MKFYSCYTCFGFCTCKLPVCKRLLKSVSQAISTLIPSPLHKNGTATKHGNARNETQSNMKTNARKFQPKRLNHSVSVVALLELC